LIIGYQFGNNQPEAGDNMRGKDEDHSKEEKSLKA
jgi:hypothetical protein